MILPRFSIEVFFLLSFDLRLNLLWKATRGCKSQILILKVFVPLRFVYFQVHTYLNLDCNYRRSTNFNSQPGDRSGIDPTGLGCLFLFYLQQSQNWKLDSKIVVELYTIQICFKKWSTQKLRGNSGVVMVGFGQKQNLKTITICDQKQKMMGNLIGELRMRRAAFQVLIFYPPKSCFRIIIQFSGSKFSFSAYN